MLIELKKLKISNNGYRRKLTLNKIFINPSHVISIVDYHGVTDFLLSEGNNEYDDKNFSLVKVNNVGGIEEVIVLGTSEEVYEMFNSKSKKRKILNG